MATANKLTYLNTTKTQLKQMISYGYPLTNETFRQYVSGVFQAMVNSMSDTLNPTWQNLPKLTTTPATSLSINNTIEAPMRIELGASELSQSGTPTPSSPQDIHIISGDNTINVSDGTNTTSYPIHLDTIKYGKIGNYEDKFIRNRGKNLCEPNAYLFTASNNTSYILDLTPLTSPYTTQTTFRGIGFIAKVEAGKTYTFSSDMSGTNYNNLIGIYAKKEDVTTANKVLELITTATFTPNYSGYAVIGGTASQSGKTITWSYAQLELGETATDYEPYGTNEWYIKKAIGKYVANNDLTGNGETDNLIQLLTPQLNITASLNTATLVSMSKCNMLSAYDSITYTGLAGTTTSSKIRINLSKDYASTEEQAKEVLSNLIIYYALATPTYTKITGELANQLEQVYKGMLSYDGTTNISQVNNDLPFVFSVSALENLI